jgi:hypothetical protein
MWFPYFLRHRIASGAPERSPRPRPSRRRRAATTLQVEPLEPRWCPSYSPITSRTALAGTDTVAWATLGTPPQYPANPFTILSNGGHSVSVSKAYPNGFVTEAEGAPGCCGQFTGNFAVGDVVLFTDDGVTTLNPITLDFGSTAVAAGGAQIDPDIGGAKPVKFIAEVDAYDASGSLLASFRETGTAAYTYDNSAIFIGISSTSANISRIALSVAQMGKFDRGWYAINEFDFRTSPLAAVRAVAAPVVGDPAPALDLGPPAPQRVAATLGTSGPSAPAASPSGALPAPGTPPSHKARATDAVFAAARPKAKDDAVGLFAPLAFPAVDVM